MYLNVYSDELYHHGVKGMQWGVRKEVVSTRGKTSRETATKFGNNHKLKASSDALAKAKSMSDAELKKRATRLELENRYVNAKTAQAGKSKIDRILSTIGTLSAVAVGAMSIYDKYNKTMGNQEEIKMNEKDFVKFCKKQVGNYTNEHLEKTDNKIITQNEDLGVQLRKTVQNNKALLSTTLFDGMYYEVTYNGDKDECYIDAYKKWENYKIAKLSIPSLSFIEDVINNAQ